MGGTSTISSMTPAAGNLRVQTSVYGSAIALIYGTTRVSGNLLWYGGFVAIPHTSTTSAGGKGGGSVQQSNTAYTYQAAVLMALGEGPLNNVLQAWKGKAAYAVQAASNVPVQRTETFTVPPGGVINVAYAAAFQNNVQVTDGSAESWDNWSGF